MKVPIKKIIIILACTGLGLAAIPVTYGVWLAYQDHQALKKLEAQRDAIAQYRQQTKTRPQDAQAHLQLGNAALAFWQESDKGFRLAFQTRQWNPLSWLEERPRALKEAVAAYTTALKLDSNLAEAQVGLCHARLEQKRQGQEAAVTALCRKAVERQPQQDKAHLFLGIALSRQSQWAGAETAFRQYLALTQNKSNAYYQLGKALLAQNKTDEAVTVLRQSIQLDGKGNLVYEELGDALAAQGKTQEAIAAYRQSLKVAPEYPPVYVKLGDALIATRQYGAAVNTYREMTQRYPTLPSGYSGLGRGLAAQQQWAAAIAAHNKAIELDPKVSWSYMDRGDTLTKQNKLDGAIADYSKALQLNPTYSGTWMNRGGLYARQGKPEAAMADLKRAVQLEPNSVTTLNSLCWNGSLLGYAAQVITACEKAVERALSPDQDFYKDSRGVAYALLGKPSAAIADFQAFLRWTESEAAQAGYEASDLQARRTKRQTWIQALQQKQNPFTQEVQQALLIE